MTAPVDPIVADAQAAVAMAANGDLPSIYFNNFGLVINAADVAVVLKIGTQSQAIAHFSHATAKDFHRSLGNLLAHFEKACGPIGSVEGNSKKLTETPYKPTNQAA